MTIYTARSRGRRFQPVIFAFLGLVLLAYPLDWTVWRLRMALGNGMGLPAVTSTTAATLKGNHFEVYGQDQENVSCSRSLLPQTGAGPCWPLLVAASASAGHYPILNQTRYKHVTALDAHARASRIDTPHRWCPLWNRWNCLRIRSRSG